MKQKYNHFHFRNGLATGHYWQGKFHTGNDDKHTLLAKNAQQKKSLSLGPSAAEINQGKLS